MMLRRFFVIVPVHNRLPQTRQLLEQLRSQVEIEPEVYVVDDGSTDGTGGYLRAQQQVDVRLHVITGDGSLWWSGAVYRGIEALMTKLCADDVMVLMNNDVRIPMDFFAHANTLLDRHPTTVIGPITIDPRQNTIGSIGHVMVSWPFALTVHPYFGEPASVLERMPATIPLDFVGARATFYPATVVQRIGNVNAAALPHYHADFEYSHRARQAGFSICACRDLVLEYESGSTGSFNTFGRGYSWGEFWSSLRDMRSVNNLRYKWRFARLCCPRQYLISYLFFDTLKMLLRSFIGIVGHRWATTIRRSANRILTPRKDR